MPFFSLSGSQPRTVREEGAAVPKLEGKRVIWTPQNGEEEINVGKVLNEIQGIRQNSTLKVYFL